MGNYFDSYDPSAYLARQSAAASAPAAEKPKANVSWLSMLPSVAAAGASFIPGVGSVVAGGLGAAGELARQKLAGEKVDLAKIGTEGALSAVPFALGRVAKVAKLGYDAAKGTNVTLKGLKVAEDAGAAATKIAPEVAAVTDNAVQAPNLLEMMKGQARGITPGAKVAGADRLGVEDASQLNQFLDGKVRPGAAANQLADLENLHKGWGKQIGETVQANNRPLVASDVSAVKMGIDKHLGDIPGIARTPGEVALVGADGKAIIQAGGGKVATDYSDNLYRDLGEVKDLEGLNKMRVKLDQDAINYGRNSAAPDPEKEKIAKAFRAGLADYVDTNIPELGAVQNLYSQSAHAQDYLKAVASPKPIGLNGLPLVPGEVVQAGKSIAGSATDGAKSLFGKIKTGTQVAVKGATALGGQELTRAVADGAGLTDAANGVTPTFDASKIGEPGTTDTGGNYADPALMAADAAGSSSLPNAGIDYEAEADKILSSGANAKAQSAQLDLLAKRQAISAAIAKGSTSKPLSATANELVGNVQSGNAAIAQLRAELSQDPSKANKNAVGGLFGNLGRGIAGTQGLEAANNEIVDVLSRLRTGAAISANEEKLYKGQLPTAFDPPEIIKQKLDRYQNLFNGLASRAQAGSPTLELAGAASN